jgi:hypothetical protein
MPVAAEGKLGELLDKESSKPQFQALSTNAQSEQEPGEEEEEESQEERDETAALAQQLEEKPENIAKRRDLLKVLDLMQKGVIVKLHIEMPSFQTRIKTEHLGLETGEEAQGVLQDYFKLGKLGLLPKELHRQLNTAEQAARKNLYRRGFDSYWGIFVPVQHYKAWKEANSKCEQRFNQVKERILAEYPSLREEVLTIYRPMAEEAWRQSALRQLEQLRQHQPNLTQNDPKVQQILESKASYITRYLQQIEAAMPDQGELARQFVYEVRLERIPLPTELAREVETADRLYQQRALQDARHRAEQESIRLQAELEQDLRRSTKEQAQQLADEFFNGVVRQVNSLISEVCTSVLEGLNRNGFLGGRSVVQLHNLLDQLKAYRDYLSDERLADQITRLQQALPKANSTTAIESGNGETTKSSRTGKGKLRLDVQPLRRVLREIGEEAREVLLELEDEPGINRLRRLSASSSASSEDTPADELGLDLAEEKPATQKARRGKAQRQQTELDLL